MIPKHRSRLVVRLGVLLLIFACLSECRGGHAVAQTAALAASAAGSLAISAVADRVDVTLTDNGFVPASLTIFEDTTVVWHNATSQARVLQATPQFQVFLPSVSHAQAAPSPGVAPSSPTAKPSDATAVFSATLSPQTTFQYTFTNQTEVAVDVAGASQFHSRLIVTHRPVDIDVKIIQPEANSLRGASLHVVAVVDSLYEVASISAAANGRTTALEFRQQAYFDKAGWHAGWAGDLDLSGTPRGASQLTVQVVDVYGGTVLAQLPFILDEKPQVAVSAPLNNSVAQPNLAISAACTDDDPLGCALLRVSASRAEFSVPAFDTLLASGKASVAANVDLSAFAGAQIWITFQATDSAGQTSEQKRFVFVENSSHLSRIEDVGGPILDVQPDRILFLDQSAPAAVLKIHQRSTGQDSPVASVIGKAPQYGFLTPKGAIFVVQGIDVTTARLYDWRDGQLVDLGQPNSASSLVVKGNYAIWSGSNGDASSGVPGLWLRDLVGGTTTLVAADAGNIENDVATNGDVVYWAPNVTGQYNIYRFRQGSSTQITNDTVLWNTYPRTDGSIIVYRKTPPCCGNPPNSALMLYQTNEITLTANVQYELQPGRDYQVSNGWVAFTKPGTGGQRQVWRRAPNGTQAQITFFGISSTLDALAPDGEVMFVSGSRRYLVPVGAPAIEIGSSLGRSFWQNGGWFIVIGRTLFQVSS